MLVSSSDGLAREGLLAAILLIDMVAELSMDLSIRGGGWGVLSEGSCKKKGRGQGLDGEMFDRFR